MSIGPLACGFQPVIGELGDMAQGFFIELGCHDRQVGQADGIEPEMKIGDLVSVAGRKPSSC